VYSKNDERMTERSVELNWLSRLQTALQTDQFCLYLQPVVSLSSGVNPQNITHFEFLLRLIDDEGKEVTPKQIIQAAERYDLMRDIDKWVIKNALRTVAELSSGPGGQCSYSINISGQSAADRDLKSFIE
jgi:Amt family ammonium transporter